MKQYSIILLLVFLFLLPAFYAAADEKPTPNQTLVEKANECINNGRIDEALRISLGLADNLENEEDLDIHVNVYNDLGVIYRRLNKNDSALYYYNKALDAAVKLDDKEWMTTLSINIAIYYHNLKHFKDAERYADMAVKYSKQQNDESYKFFACQIASPIKTEVKKPDEALSYAREAWVMANGKNGNDEMRLRCIPSLTILYDELGKTDSVFHYIDIGNRILDNCDNDITRVGFIQNRGEMYYRHQRWNDALRDMLFLTKAGATLNNILYRKIADCYRHLGEYRKAYCYMDTARMWTDSLAAKDIEEKLAEFNVKYESKEKEMQLAEAHSLHASQRVKWLIVLLVAVMLIAALMVVLIIVRHRHKVHLMFVRQCAELNEARQYIEGLEAERTRMARELHDGVSNGLLGVSLKLKGADNPDDVHTIISDVEHLRNEVRTLSHGLMPPEFTKYNLSEILGFYIDGLKDVKVQFYANDDDDWSVLSKEVSFEVFRIAQECISNALSHSNADIIKVSLSMSEDKTGGSLQVEDNGNTSKAVADTVGIGTRVIQERVKTIDGRIDFRKRPDGTVVTLHFPF